MGPSAFLGMLCWLKSWRKILGANGRPKAGDWWELYGLWFLGVVVGLSIESSMSKAMCVGLLLQKIPGKQVVPRRKILSPLLVAVDPDRDASDAGSYQAPKNL